MVALTWIIIATILVTAFLTLAIAAALAYFVVYPNLQNQSVSA